MGRLLHDDTNLSGPFPLAGGTADTKSTEDGHELEEGLGTGFEVGPDSSVLGQWHGVLQDPQWLAKK